MDATNSDFSRAELVLGGPTVRATLFTWQVSYLRRVVLKAGCTQPVFTKGPLRPAGTDTTVCNRLLLLRCAEVIQTHPRANCEIRQRGGM